MKETDLMNKIRLDLQSIGCKTFRVNVGKGKTPDGRYFDTGVPKGFSDILGVRKDGVACFIEVKVKPNKPTLDQCNFLLAMIKQGCPAGIAFSVEDARNIVKWKEDYALESETTIRMYLQRWAVKCEQKK